MVAAWPSPGRRRRTPRQELARQAADLLGARGHEGGADLAFEVDLAHGPGGRADRELDESHDLRPRANVGARVAPEDLDQALPIGDQFADRHLLLDLAEKALLAGGPHE